jgi:hypothetical protein
VRQRRNKKSTAATLPAAAAEKIVRAPQLPRGTDWHPDVREWWHAIWHSAMAALWLPSDVHRVKMVLPLRQAYATKPTEKLALAIARLEATLGISPEDRARLHWKIDPDAKTPPAPAKTAKEIRDAGEDPRKALRAI